MLKNSSLPSLSYLDSGWMPDSSAGSLDLEHRACGWIAQHTGCPASGHKFPDWNRVTPTCSQALLHLFQVLLQALLLNEQTVLLLLKLLDPAAACSMISQLGKLLLPPQAAICYGC